MTFTRIKHSPPTVVPTPVIPPAPPASLLKSSADTLTALSQPVDKRHYKTLTKGKGDNQINLSFIPWAVICKCLHSRCPQWNFEIQEVKEVAGSVVVIGRLTIPTTDGLLHFSGVASERLDSGSMAPPIESAASAALRRAAALAGLGLDLYL